MEMIGVVDDNDTEIGSACLDDIYSRNLTHRIVHVLIFNKKKELLLQLRSREKKGYPFHWSTSVGGHVRAGETYEGAALRGAREEIGTDVEFDLVGKDVYLHSDVPKKFLTTFRCTHEGPFAQEASEVEMLGFYSLGEIKRMIGRGERFHPELLFLLKKYFNLN